MTKKPRMGSDPFQKKDPLGWIAADSSEKPGKQEGAQSQPGNSDKPSKLGEHGAQGPPSKIGNPSKQGLPSPPSSPETPSTPSKPPRGSTTSKGLRPGWTRATFIVRKETVEQLKAVAYWDRKELKRVVDEAFQAYLRERPSLEPIPPEVRPQIENVAPARLPRFGKARHYLPKEPFVTTD